MTKLSVILLLLALLPACGEPNVGDSCTGPADCDDDLTCNTSVVGGYCTAVCTEAGSQSQCPEGSICDHVATPAFTCVKICKTHDDCRSDQECNGTSGSNVKACKPKLTD